MATPRMTRARSRSKTPLPAIGAKASSAYGAEGKANLKAQLKTPTTDFASAFAATRQESKATDDADQDEDEIEVEAPAPSKSPTKRRGRPPKTPLASNLPLVEEVPEEPSPQPDRSMADRTGTVLDAGADYARNGVREEAVQAETAHPEPERPQPTRRERARSNRRRTPDGDTHDSATLSSIPSRIRVFARTLPRYVPVVMQNTDSSLKDAMVVLAALILFLTMWAWVPLPDSVDIYRDNFFFGLKTMCRIPPYSVPPTVLEARWNRFKHDEIFREKLPPHNMEEQQWAINAHFLERMERVEKTVAGVRDDMTQQIDSMRLIQDLLPSQVVVQVINGQYEIPDPFWSALQERLVTESNLAPLWTAYIQHNNAQILELNTGIIQRSVGEAMEERKVISQTAFMEAIRQNNEWLTQQFRHESRDTQQKQTAEMQRLAARAANDELERSEISMYAKDHLETLIKAKQVYNAYDSLHTVNWFAVGLGARIDPYMTSPTHNMPQKRWYQSAYELLSPIVSRPHSPIYALQSWTEATECWCASNSAEGQTQITVQTAAKIYPDRLIIEHVPAHGTINIAAAPRFLEVWAHAPSTRAANKLDKAMEDEDNTRFFEDKCGPKPAPHLVCIGRGKYDIHISNHIQAIPVFADTPALAFGINKFTVRIVGNWGADWTCLYRLRMTGQQVGVEEAEPQ